MKIADKEFAGPFSLNEEDIPEGRAIYIISGDDVPLYIGTAEKLRARLRQHRANGTFDGQGTLSISYWPFNESQISEARRLEAELVYDLRPKLNKARFSPEAAKFYESKLQADRARKYSTIVAGVTSSVAAALTLSMLLGVFQDKSNSDKDEIEARITKIESSQDAQEKVIAGLALNVKSLQASIEAASTKPNALAINRELARKGEELKVVAAKVSALESALNSDPAKSLAVPLLRKDLDNTRDSFKANLDQTKSEIDRIYDQNKWFIGLMFTIALSVLGMAASNFLSRKESEQSRLE